MSFIAQKLQKIQPSPTIAITNKARELQSMGVDIVELGAGEPDFDTPENVKFAAIEAIKLGKTKYTAVDGTITLKKAVQGKFKRENNIDYTTDEITIGTGAKQVLYNALISTINPGDEVIIPAPYWVSYPDITLLCDGNPVIVKTSSQNNFKITAEEVNKAITPKTKWLILNSPNNPTGSCYTHDDLRKIADVLLEKEHVHVLTDDIYEHITYDNFKFYTIAQVEPKLKDRVFTLNGVSKSYAMTGWRLGYGGGSKEIIKAIAKIQSQSTSNPSSISQEAAVEALNGPQDFIVNAKQTFEKRRNLIIDGLNQINGIRCFKPSGAFYAFASIESLLGKTTPAGLPINNCTAFAAYLLEEAKVAIVPGIAFGYENYFRASYATNENTIKEALSRIKKAVEELG